MKKTIYVLDNNNRIIGHLEVGNNNSNKAIIQDKLTRYARIGSSTYEFTVLFNEYTSSLILEGNKLAFRDITGDSIFTITSIEETHDDDLTISVYCESVGLSLTNQVCRSFKQASMTAKAFIEKIMQGTNIKLGSIDYSINTILDIDVEVDSVYSILQNYAGKYGYECVFSADFRQGNKIETTLNVIKANHGIYNGKRFEFGKNINSIRRKIDKTELYTALIGVGKDNINFSSVEAEDKPLGQDWIGNEEAKDNFGENGQHLFGIFSENTESANELLEKTRIALKESSKLKIDYEVSIELLGTQVEVGEWINIIDHYFAPSLLLSARVDTIETSNTDPDLDNIKLSNYIKRNSNITQQLLDELNGFVDNKVNSKFPITSSDISDGAVTGDKIFEYSITTDHLKANSITAEKITAESIEATHITAESIETKHLQANSVTAEKIVAESITAEHIQAGAITSDKIVTDGLLVGDANILDINAKKINAGELNTNKVNIQSEDGSISIIGSTQQFKDDQGRIRLQLGKDKQGKFTFTLFGENGTGILINENGIQPGAIGNDLINEEMIGGNVIGEKHINYSSLITGFNKDTNTDYLKATKIRLDNVNQTLEVGFTNLNKTVTDEKTKLTALTTDFKLEQGKILGLVSETEIIKSEAIEFKDKIGKLEVTSGKINAAVLENTSKITDNKTETDKKIGEITVDFKNIKLNVEENKTSIIDLGSELGEKITIEDARAEIDLKSNNILLQVQTSGGGNLISDGDLTSGLLKWEEYRYAWESEDSKIQIWDDNNEWILQGTRALTIICRGYEESGEFGVQQYIPVKKNQTYTISCLMARHRCDGGFHVYDAANWEWLGHDTILESEPYNAGKDIQDWKKVKVTFNSGNRTQVGLRYWMSKSSDNGHLWICQPMMNEGNLALPFTAKNITANEMISYINLDSSSVKIKSNKIELNGAVTAGDNSGNHVKIEEANYTILNNGQQRALFGFKNMGNSYDNYVVPKLAMGAYGYASSHNYFTIVPYRGGDNPQGLSNAYVDIAYHCISNNDFSNIKMYDGGDIRLAPLKNLEITTNYVDGNYGGTGERRLALFTTINHAYFNSHLQIGCIRNMTNGMGLILADDTVGGAETRIRVNTDSNRQKFIRPCDNVGDIGCGSSGFPWKSVATKTLYGTDGIVSFKNKTTIDNGDILNNIHFIHGFNRGSKIVMDVSAISGTAFAPIEENVQVIDVMELLKLALMEIKQLKNKVGA